MTKVSGLPIPIAPPEEMGLIVDLIEEAFTKVDRIAAESDKARHLIERLDQATLTKAFRGELVPDDQEPRGSCTP